MNTLLVATKLVRHAFDARGGRNSKPGVGDDRALVWIAAVSSGRYARRRRGQSGGDTGHRGRHSNRGFQRSNLAGGAPA